MGIAPAVLMKREHWPSSPIIANTQRGKIERTGRLFQRRWTYVDLHFLIQAVIHDQAVSHSYAVRFHWMPRNIGIVAHVRIVEVRNGLLLGASWCCDLHIHGGKRCHDF